jgi:predicted DNA-binding ribbon-helix-helix protein
MDSTDDGAATLSEARPGSRGLDASKANQNVKPESFLISKNVTINGHRTSVRMEPQIWNAIEDILYREGLDRHAFFTSIANRLKDNQSLSSAARTFVVTYYRESATETGHLKAGHGSRIIS